MRRFLYSIFAATIFYYTLALTPAVAQSSGIITGTATDESHDVLPGALVKLQPGDGTVTTNQQGQFTFTNVTPGTYTVTVSYLGFTDATASVTVSAGQATKVDRID